MIDDIKSLRALYAEPKGRALSKQLTRLDEHCSSFIKLSPFVVIASGGREGHLDASPRGGEPGFVKILDDQTLLIPDAKGNNRLDTLTNIIEYGKIGLLFLIPGVDETLRINGHACLNDDPDLIRHFANERNAPKLVISVSIAEAYLHCAKALMRSKLWSVERQVDRAVLPTLGQMINDQTGSQDPVESQEQMVARYTKDL
jgi:PPOX class probable FMN-dependent enzyme